MKTYIRLLLITAMLVPVVSCHKKERNKSEEIPQIEVAEAMTDSVVLHKTYPGYLSADNSAEVVGKVNGQILTQNYRAGAYVNRGDVLFTIDPTLYRDAVERARASLASAISSRDYAKDHYEAVKKALEAEAVSKWRCCRLKALTSRPRPIFAIARRHYTLQRQTSDIAQWWLLCRAI